MRYILFCFAIVLSGQVRGQRVNDSDVPAVVKNAFGRLFPGAKSIRWSKENTAEFEVEFKTGAVEQSANFSATGKWLETETEINKKELPEKITATIAREFPGFTIDEPERIEAAGAPLSYEVEVKKNGRTFEVQFSTDGKTLSKKEKAKNK